jgi:hypothetical protein
VNEQEQEKYEADLRRTAPARLPEHFLARLRAAKPGLETPQRTSLSPVAAGLGWLGFLRPRQNGGKNRVVATSPGWQSVLRWLAPATGLAVVALLIAHVKFNPENSMDKKSLAVANGLKVDDVQVDQELVSSFDVVAKLPSGEPVRFRCQKWKDQLVVTDKNSGVEIEQSSPRVEVVPVRFETY